MRIYIWAAAFVVLWSSGYVGSVLADAAGSAAGILAWRYLATAAVVGGYVVLARRARPTRSAVAHHAALGLLSHVVCLGGVFGAAGAGVDAGTVALVCALQPILVSVVGRVAWGDPLRTRQGVGLTLGVVAVAVTVGGTGAAGPGVLLAVLALLSLSGAALLERRPHDEVDLATGLGIQVVVAAGVFTAYAVLDGRLVLAPTGATLQAMAWLIVLSGIGGYAAFSRCLTLLGGTRTSLLLYLTPPVTTLWAWAALASVPTVAQCVGLLLGAVAVLLSWPARVRAPA